MRKNKKIQLLLNKYFIISKYTKLVVFDDSAIVLSLKTMKYFELNEETYYIWKNLELHKQPIKLIKILVEEYGIDNEERIINDIVNISKFFVENKLWVVKKSH